MILAFLAGLLIYGIFIGILYAIVWMFTTVFGLAILVILLLAFIGHLISPEDQEDEEEVDADDRDL